MEAPFASRRFRPLPEAAVDEVGAAVLDPELADVEDGAHA